MKIAIEISDKLMKQLIAENRKPVRFGLVADEDYVSMESPPKIRNRDEAGNSLGQQAVRLVLGELDG